MLKISGNNMKKKSRETKLSGDDVKRNREQCVEKKANLSKHFS